MNYFGEVNVNTTVTHLRRSQVNTAVGLLSDAFANDPIFRYLIPELEPARTRALQCVINALLCSSLSYGHVYTTSDPIKGVAAWLPPGQAPVPLLRLLQAGLYQLPFHLHWSHWSRWISLLKWEDYQRQDMPRPHWYLMLLGVVPDYQRQGIGGLLLNPILAEADREGMPCYLETSTESAVCFYQRHGFDVIRTEPLSEQAPWYWTMKREPGGE
ncbi:GNAT family N-acetyltransferase [Oculatella sp. LEGE 06141]|uniref:GNAT family N-acetyltransferase n=1 Tax=Oculatella sp. LEGE 06141 TaxID=1828648 RepID=UPI001881D2FA|nr:GNAT family N-acetyltransferase [Oculatella sp. LEGE 06141]MBE9179047.1 GNAT family N-acetyltransferase [Oculatella sp. LEGE 06141]